MSGIKDYPNNAIIQAILPHIQDGASEAMDKMKKIREWGVVRYKAKGVNSAEKFQAEAVEDCKAVSDLLAAKASTQEASEYRRWAMSIAEKVAMATTEGSFFGFGGERFSANERELFNRIESAFGVQTLLA
jgi:membrane-bound lytic murein transglycosylase B